jgi:uncharacterized protein YecE (DUF72 family)
MIYVGTSGWAYSTWKPDFYPPKVAQKKFLEYYATRLNSVEVNYTFRQLPSASTLAGWLAVTGADFRFSFKAPQRITHFQRLKDSAGTMDQLVAALEPVIGAGRMGLVLLQLPPNFKADGVRLAEFLGHAGKSGVRLAFEFRHESWFAEEIFDILGKHDVALCAAESDTLETPDVVTASFACYRLRKSSYAPEELKNVAARLRTQASSGEVFAYFKHEEDPSGALSGVKVRELLA